MPSEGRTPRRDAGRPRGRHVTDAVLDAALAELASAGLEGFSVERVAGRADVHKTTVYRRWPRRGELIVAALERLLDDAAERVPDTGSLRGDLTSLLEGVAAFVSQPIGRAIVRAALSAQSEVDVAALAARRLEGADESAMTALVARALDRGEWRDGVSGEQVAHVLVGAILHRSLLEHCEVTPEWLATAVDLVLLGVAPRPTALLKGPGNL